MYQNNIFLEERERSLSCPSHDFTSTILVYQNNETEAMLVYQNNPVELASFIRKNVFVPINLHGWWSLE